MNFAALYNNNRAAVARALSAMWCGESANDSQKAYIAQMKSVIGNLFAPQNAVPVVQCMNSYMPVAKDQEVIAKALVGGLWTAPYAPYQHQYACWDALLNGKTADGKPKSVVVTTGTGSGKTECFMMPLIYDLSQHAKPCEIQALFLYPLNALMEDQKERLEEMLTTVEKTTGVRLTYTVYNGDLPEIEPKDTDESEDADKLRKRIEQVTGGHYECVKDPTTGRKRYELRKAHFSHMVYTRKAVRLTPPNIVLTNPTMLEYVLLRSADASLTVSDKKSLRWVAIDETHSYTGAGAAELAMLLRRVLLAYGVKAEDIRFATSSATFGNGEDREQDERDLKAFISGITGVRTEQVEVVGGERVGEHEIPQSEDAARWRQIFRSDYISLDELYPEAASISQKLQWLDEMCEREAARCQAAGLKFPTLKIKVHYFYRVPNNGLYVRLNEAADGAFKIYTENVITSDHATEGHPVGGAAQAPLLELSRCKHCGEYVAVARIDIEHWTYESIATDDSDMFDLEDEEEEGGNKKYAIFGLSNGQNMRGDNNVKFSISPDGKLTPLTLATAPQEGEWHVVGNLQGCCPYCNTKQTKSHNTERDIEDDADGNMEDNRLQKFRLSADFISRILAPSVLDQLEKGTSQTGGIVLHEGQQYISFVDSRQAAAKATLKQNLEQERMWLYSTIYHELCRRAHSGLSKETAMSQVLNAIQQNPADALKYATMLANLQSADAEVVNQQLAALTCKHMTWGEVSRLIKNDPYCPVFCSLFVKRTADSDEMVDGQPSEETMDKYVQSLMVMYLAHRPASAASPENMGLFETCYPQLAEVKLPQAVQRFNDEVLDSPANKITEKDWRDLMQVYLDYTVRNNQSFYLKIPGNDRLDIFSTVRFATEKPRRRPFTKPKLEEGKVSQARVVRYLCALIARDDGSLTINEAQHRYFNEISDVIDALWDTLTGNDYDIMRVGERLDDNGRWVKERDNAPRLNLNDLCFKLYDDVYLCDTKADDKRHAVCLRPIGNNFKRFSPYLSGSVPVELKEDLHAQWSTFPYYKGTAEQGDVAKIEAWAKDNRSLLWDNHVWGEDGVFADRLTDIYAFPNLFVQQEHTAQVDKSVARGLQSRFKDHTVNILACSTTMEMGVDLGNLEVVMLSSVPPQPANYKQRAGRSGRNNKIKSACITLCGSDIIGLRTLADPIGKIISRAVRVPMVDLMSQQVVQRHVNSFLIRAFGVFADGKNGGRLTQKVADYYTPFEVRLSNGKVYILDGNKETDPDSLLGNSKGTMYEKFNLMCSQPLAPGVRNDLITLLADTTYEGQINQVVRNAQEANERIYAELRNKLVDYKTAFSGNGVISEPFRKKLKMQYMEVLYQRLLNFWATSRFTPNANMPVNVLTLDLNSNGKKDFFTSTTSSNPSYPLRDAIAQYAPGNSVAVDGVVYIVRGIEVTNMYDDTRKAYKTIYRNNDRTAIDDSSLSNAIKWTVNDDYGLQLVQPMGFMPDMNEDKTRIMDSNVYTRVSAQLIDADDWSNNVTEPHLFSVRPNSDTGNAKILYYNEGRGYGYCYCPGCGRMVLEEGVADANNKGRFPYDFNPIVRKAKEGQPPRPNYHLAITGKDMRKPCACSNMKDRVKRNVIIGDLIQTDYSEIRIRHKGQKKWISNRSNEEDLLFTLGIVMTQALVDILGKERGAVDFAIMPNGHLCIFDCNPGGAGYANQLANVTVMKEVIKATKKMLEEAKQKQSKDMLLDKFTLRYAKYIDVGAALDWIAEEEEVGDTIPQNVKDAFPGLTPSQANLFDLEKAFANSSKQLTLFADNDFMEWDYDNPTNGWQPQLMSRFVTKSAMTTFCLMESDKRSIAEPIKAIVREINAWAKAGVARVMPNPYKDKGIYPLAYIDDYLYFTCSQEHAQLNVQWGNDTMFFVRVSNPIALAQPIDTAFLPTTKLLKLSGDNYKQICTTQLGQILQTNSGGLIDAFVTYAKQQEGDLIIAYQDEHLKSVMGMVLTIQTMGHFVRQIGKDFSVEYKVEKYKDDKGSAESFTRNQPSSEQRDCWLTSLTQAWLGDLQHEEGVKGKLLPVVSGEKRSLVHWRELSIRCGKKRLSIYPDGGFINEWNIGKQPNGEYYDTATVTYDTPVYLYRNKEIKFDIELVDVD